MPNVALAKENGEGLVWGFLGSLVPLHAVTFYRIQMMLALSECPSILGWTASRMPVRDINRK
jgi:hypothetical protein